MKNKNIITIGIFALFTVGNMNAQKKPYLDKNKTIEQRIDLLLPLMTLEEKVGQMNQYNGFWDVTGPAPKGGKAELKYEHLRKGLVGSMLTVRGVKEVRAVQKIAVEETRLGIPLIIGFDVIHGYKTLSPIPLAEAASWDLEAIKKSAAIAADEASASGINWTFGPNVDVANDARWGRVMEGAGEDPYLGSKVGYARVKGFQGETIADLAKVNTIAACAKHFAAYGYVEAGLEYNIVDISNSKLYNSVLPPFEATVEAGVRTFMNSFNTLNGVPATGNAFLQRDILKGKWKFDGFVISDYASIREMIAHGYAKDEADAVAALQDLVAEPARTPLLPELPGLRAALAEKGILHLGISGAGPTLFALCSNDEQAQLAADYLSRHYEKNQDATTQICRLSQGGARAL